MTIEKHKARLAEFKAAFARAVRRTDLNVPEDVEIEFDPTGLAEMVSNGFFDQSDEEWSEMIREMGEEVVGEPVRDDDRSPEAEVARKRIAEHRARQS